MAICETCLRYEYTILIGNSRCHKSCNSNANLGNTSRLCVAQSMQKDRSVSRAVQNERRDQQRVYIPHGLAVKEQQRDPALKQAAGKQGFQHAADRSGKSSNDPQTPTLAGQLTRLEKLIGREQMSMRRKRKQFVIRSILLVD